MKMLWQLKATQDTEQGVNRDSSIVLFELFDMFP